MRLKPICILFFIPFVIASCHKTQDLEFPYEARVLGVNSDCGIYAIQFLSHLDEIEAKFGNTVDGIFIGKNLPEEFQKENLIIQLNCRVPLPDELGFCTMMGPTYPWVFITDAQN